MRPIVEYPALLALAIVLPAAAAFLVRAAYRARKARLERFGSPRMIERLVPPAAARAPTWRGVRLALAAALVGIALAGPRWGSERSVVRGEGLDVAIVVDASLSMMATDERPNRLEKVKQEVRRFLDASGGDRFALLAFAGRSYILTPLTVDRGAFDLFLDNLDPTIVGQAGSSLSRAIRQGTDLLGAARSGSDRALVLFSDGEAFEPVEEIIAAAKEAAANGVSLVMVGVGTTAGSTIQVKEGNAVTLKRDENGAVVVTRYHPEMLQAAANGAGGTFIDAAQTDKAALIRRALQRLHTERRTMESGRSQKPRFQLFLLPAALLLIADTLLTERRGRRRRAAAAASTATAASVAAALLFAMMPLHPARAGDLEDAQAAYRAGQYARAAALFRRALERGDKRPEMLYDYGTALLAADSLGAAAEVLERAAQSTDPEVRYRALFNLGLAHLKRGLGVPGDSGQQALDQALDVYKRALRMRSGDADAKWNYELALRKKKSGGGGGGGGSSQSNSSQSNQSTPEQPQSERPSGGMGQQQADQLLNSAAREERDVQGRRQGQSRPQPPPGGKDW